MSMGSKLRILREEKRLRQEDVGDLFSMGKSAVSQWENDIRVPDPAIIKKLAEFFNVPSDYLLGITDNPTPYLNDMSVYTGEKNAVFPLGEQRKINIYNLIPTNRDEIFAKENIIGSQLVFADSIYTKGFKAIDSSMSGSQILMGTHVLIEEDDTPLDGEIVVAQIPGNTDLLIRIFTTANDEITLIADNSNYKPQTFRAKDVRIIGIVTESRTYRGRKSK